LHTPYVADSKPDQAQERTEQSSRPRTKTITTQHSTENVIFIFISDIGADRMTKLVLSYGNRSAIPQALLRSEIKTALDAQWSRLRFGKFVTEVVPYLPLEPEHIREILHAKLRNMAASHRHSYWAELVVDADVLSLIAAPPMVKYSVYSAKSASGAGTQGSPAGSGTCSAGGGAGEDGECAGGAPSSENPTGANVGQGTGTTKIFATWGARSLENAGECITDQVHAGDALLQDADERVTFVYQARCRTSAA
jgi:hypothetical protein